MPLLITALDLPNPALRANVIETLAVLVKEVASEIEGSVTGIVTKLVKGLSSLVINSNTKGSVVRFFFFTHISFFFPSLRAKGLNKNVFALPPDGEKPRKF